MKYQRSIMLSCFLVAGLWAGSIVTYVAVSTSPTFARTADLTFDSAFGAKFLTRPRLLKPSQPEPGQTTPYEESTAPQFQFPTPVPPQVAPIPEVTITAPAVPQPEVAPVVPQPEGVENQIQGVLSAVQSLFNGDGNFQDILTIGLFALSIYGGYNIGASDGLFKIILGIFSKKSNYDQILDDKVVSRRPLLRRRRETALKQPK